VVMEGCVGIGHIVFPDDFSYVADATGFFVVSHVHRP
jgi:hypothetical protein